MNPKYILMAVIIALQFVLSTNAKLDAKVRPYIIQVRDLALMLVPLEEVKFSKKAALKTIA